MTYRPSALEKLERKLRPYAVRNLMLYIVCAMATVYVLDYLLYPRFSFSASQWLFFSRDAIFAGQVWRLVTFIIVPSHDNFVFVALSLYLDYLVGSALQNQWGSVKFNLYYLCGMLGAIISGLITGFTTNMYLNMSLFFAFGIIYPNFELMVMMLLPVKVKFLAILSGISVLLSLIASGWDDRLAIVMSLANVALFFWKDVYNLIHNAYRRYQWKKNWRR